MVRRSGLTRFMYNGSGSGCRTWVIRLVELFEEQGLIPPGSLQGCLEKMDEAIREGIFWVPRERGAIFF